MSIGENIRRIRKVKSLTQIELAKHLGVSKGLISQYESGKAYPPIDKVISMAKLFSVTTDDLINKGELDQEIDASGALSDRLHLAMFSLINPDRYKHVKFISYKTWSLHADGFDTFNFDDVKETYPVYLPGVEEPVTDQHFAFEIMGDSMEPTIHEQSRVLAEIVNDSDIDYIDSGVFIVAFRKQMVIKRVKDNNLLINNTLTLHSDNPYRGQITIRRNDIHRIWRVSDIISGKVR